MSAPPPPPLPEEEGSSPPAFHADLHDVVVQRIRARLRQTGRHDELGDPSFAGRFARHVHRLPRRYLIGYLAGGSNNSRADDDVLLHWRILDECADPSKRPIFHARFMRAMHQYVGGGDEADDQELRLDTMFLHEIVFASVDRPRVLSRLTALVSEVALNIREAHLYSTLDGFLLVIFRVDGWETEDEGDLITKLKDTSALYPGLS